MPIITFLVSDSRQVPNASARAEPPDAPGLSTCTATVPEGTSLLDAAVLAGVPVTAPCGGEGVCGECRLRVEAGLVDYVPRGCLTAEQLAQAWVLACSSRVAGDATVVIPQPERPTDARIVSDGPARAPESGLRTTRGPTEPLACKLLLRVRPPSSGGAFSDHDRLISALGSDDALATTSVCVEALRELPGALRAHDHQVTVTLIPRDEHNGAEVIRVEPGDTTEHQLGLAIDVGTTTCAVSLVDVKHDKVLGTGADYNAQLSRGADIISRINYATTPERTAELRQLALETINGLIVELCASRRIASTLIDSAALAANTTMVHLLLGIDPQHIRLAPYTPATNRPPCVYAREVGIAINPNGRVVFAPGVGSYVGGDVTAGLLVTTMSSESDEVRLYLDIGTNGEVVVGTGEWLMTCAASAGPAFEGGGITCGMRAAKGAVERVRVDPQTGRAAVTVIGGGKPRGVCGSGMIDLLAELYAVGLLGPSGKLDATHASGSVKPADGAGQRLPAGRNLAYTIVPEGESATGKALTIDERDIQNLLRTKAAVYSACAIMLNSVGLEFDAIAEVYVAGGFGRYLDVRKSILIGMLPDIPLERFTYLGTASLTGARSMLCHAASRRNVARLADRMTYMELNADPAYMSEYTAALFIPHTDMDRFPSVGVSAAMRRGLRAHDDGRAPS
ncbi:MAG: ASKHA domain-containing protein [Phycisphaerae bacterium]